MNAASHDSNPSICPFLGTLENDGSSGDAIEYPSFENRCLATKRSDPLMLTDQATFCLSKGHRYCPRFVANRAAQPVSTYTSSIERGFEPEEPQSVSLDAFDSDFVSAGLADLDADIRAGETDQRTTRRRWGWIGASLIFLSSLLCGGIFAAYVGWQLVDNTQFAVQPGRVDTVAVAPTPMPRQVYLIVTATSQPQAAVATPVPQQDQSGSQPVGGFPAAVLPTANLGSVASSAVPAVNGQSNSDSANPQVPQGAAAVQESQSQLNPGGDVAALNDSGRQPPAIDVQLQIPTRRPTPILNIQPGMTDPEPTPTLPPTPTPTVVLGPPVVVFGAEDSELEPGKCTLVSWHVENVRAVYYENLGVNGHGEKEECVRDDPGEYTLTVVLPDGGMKTYTTTVAVLLPTNTPTPTPTFAPPPEFTPTWTPTVPTATPTPDYNYGVLLAVDGEAERNCTADQDCEFSLLVTNTSRTVDDISVRLVENGSWSVRICRLDGVCSSGNLTIVSMGPSNTAMVRILVTVPTDAADQSASYGLMAISEGSGGAAVSDVATITARAGP